MTDPTPLSPAAQAVLDAYANRIKRDPHGRWVEPAIAAALRAAADHLPDPQMSAHTLPQWTFIEEPPLAVGYWVIGSAPGWCTKFAVHRQPNWLHRFMTKLLLGWEWEQAS